MDHPSLPAALAATHGLRPIRATDAAPWYDYLRDPHVVQHTSWNVGSEAQLEAQIRARYLSTEPDHPIRYALTEVADDHLVGTVGLSGIVREHRHAEIAYDLAPGQWGRGLAGEVRSGYEEYGTRIAERNDDQVGGRRTPGFKDVRRALAAADSANVPLLLARRVRDALLEGLSHRRSIGKSPRHAVYKKPRQRSTPWTI